MTEKIFEQYMRTEPDSLEHRYLFVGHQIIIIEDALVTSDCFLDK